MAYKPELDEEVSSTETIGGIIVTIMQYNKGQYKISLKDKNDYPIKRIPLDDWEEISEKVEELKMEL